MERSWGKTMERTKEPAMHDEEWRAVREVFNAVVEIMQDTPL